MAGYDLRAQASSRPQLRELSLAAERFSDLLEPVFMKCRLQFPNDRTFQPRVHIAPVFRRFRVALPLVRKPYPAGETNAAVYNKHPTMRAAIHAINSPGSHRVIVGKGTCGFLKGLYVAVIKGTT